MQFVSQGSALITNNLNLARRRMFLLTADVARPTATDTLSQLMAKIDKARSFSHSKTNGKLNCTRAAGWAGNQYFHTLVGPMRYDWSDEGTSSGTDYLSMSSTVYSELLSLARMYSIGATPQAGGTFASDSGTLHDTATDMYEDLTADIVLRYPTMLLPNFEGTLTDGKVFDTTDEAVTNSTASSGNIGSVGQYERRAGNYVQTWYQTANNAGQRTYTGASVGLGNYSAGTEFALSGQTLANSVGPRIIYGSAWSMYGSRYYSGGGWVYSYSRGKLNQSSKSIDAHRLYGKGTDQTNTANYSFDWGVLPVIVPGNQLVLQIADFASDLSQTGTVGVGAIPQIATSIQDLPANRSVFSV